jgi:hypothetical protein
MSQGGKRKPGPGEEETGKRKRKQGRGRGARRMEEMPRKMKRSQEIG